MDTAARSGEARNAIWAEVDTEAREWRIPGSRMKGGREHRVPLSDAALVVLEHARALDDGSGLVFPSPLRAGRPLSDMTLTKILRDRGLAERATVHGFRSAFRDWCAETGKPREIAEAALAHTVGGVEGAYFRSDLFARRRALMDQWAEFLTETGAKVAARWRVPSTVRSITANDPSEHSPAQVLVALASGRLLPAGRLTGLMRRGEDHGG